MKKLAAVLALAVFMMPGLASSAFAQDHGDREHHGHDRDHDHDHDHGAWHMDRHWHGDIHHFRDDDLHYWHSGRWYHGHHGGRIGWWWILGDTWYFYPHAAYPYPNPYIPPAVAAPPGAGAYWYACNNPQGYYPYVPTCYAPWHAMPAGGGAPPP
ncbi:MAG TPA: hypothetical protein VMV79_04470 [Alphaproteobacteria bacterium]|nr:hypothetical protein [Alphaproteobacteria bacterium]